MINRESHERALISAMIVPMNTPIRLMVKLLRRAGATVTIGGAVAGERGGGGTCVIAIYYF